MKPIYIKYQKVGFYGLTGSKTTYEEVYPHIVMNGQRIEVSKGFRVAAGCCRDEYSRFVYAIPIKAKIITENEYLEATKSPA